MTHSAKSIWRDLFAFEEIWCIYLKAITSKIVGKELDGICYHRINKLDLEEAVGQHTRVFGNSRPKTSVK